MRDEQERDADLALDLLQLDLHLLAELEVEGPERLVEEQDAGPVDERPRQGDPLALSARELGGTPPLEPLKADGGQRRDGPLTPLRPADLLDPQAVLHVVQDAHVREERVVLEHRVDVPLEGGQAGDVLAAELDRARGGGLEARDHPEHGGLAGPRRAQHREELAVGDLEVDSGDGLHGPEALAQAAQPYRHVVIWHEGKPMGLNVSR